MNAVHAYRSWIWLAAALLAIGVVNLVGSRSSSAAPALSVSSSANDGALALALWLPRIGRGATTINTSTDPCDRLSPGKDVLLVMRNGADVPSSAMTSCQKWLDRGGRIVVVSNGATAVPLLDALQVHVVPSSAADVTIVQPAFLRPPASRIQAQASSVIEAGVPGMVAASTAGGPALVRFAVGRGDLWVVAAPQLLENQSLPAGDNAAVVENLLPSGSHVWIEEYAGGSEGVAAARSDWLTGSSWGVAFLFAFGVILLYRGMTGIRLGPPVRPLRDTHRPASEYVVSMAGTLRDAKKRPDVLQHYRDHLTRVLRERHIDSSVTEEGRQLAEEAAALLRESSPASDGELVLGVRNITEFEDRLEKTRV